MMQLNSCEALRVFNILRPKDVVTSWMTVCSPELFYTFFARPSDYDSCTGSSKSLFSKAYGNGAAVRVKERQSCGVIASSG